MQNNSSHGSCGTQRSVDQSEDVFVENPVGVISVALLVAVVQRPIIIIVLIFDMLYNRKSVNCNTEIWSPSSDLLSPAFSI